MPRELLVIACFIAAYTASPIWVRHNWFLRRGTQLMVMKKPTAFSHPLRNCVRELCADGQIHVRKFNEISAFN